MQFAGGFVEALPDHALELAFGRSGESLGVGKAGKQADGIAEEKLRVGGLGLWLDYRIRFLRQVRFPLVFLPGALWLPGPGIGRGMKAPPGGPRAVHGRNLQPGRGLARSA